MQANHSCIMLESMGTYINKGNNAYVMLLRRLFKTQDSDEVFAGAYLTGILPIKRYNTESALNNFCEYSMIDPAYLAPCYGFTEYATGKGYADLVMIPRRNVNKPALVIELKYNHSANTAIEQIKRKDYPSKIAEYTGDIVLVGINYDKDTKQHSCKIEKLVK